MSLPTFKAIDPPLTFEASLNMILASIAMEELGLSHIINAEGEKLQYILGTLYEDQHKPCCGADVPTEELLAVNKSVKSLLDTIAQNQLLLKGKMESALAALEGCVCHVTGPTGPPGPPGGGCAAAFTACSNQCWEAGKTLRWQHCPGSERGCLYLDPCRHKIVLEQPGAYALSFAIDIRPCDEPSRYVSLSVQTDDGFTLTDHFIYHSPPISPCSPITLNACGLLVTTREPRAELALTLLSPAKLKVKQGSIWLTRL